MGKKIWIFHPYATPKEIIGLTRPYEFAKELLKLGYKVKIFTSSYLHYISENKIKDNSLGIEETYDGVEFVFIKTRSYSSNGMDRVKNFIDYYLNSMKYIKRYLKREKPNFIYASSPHPLALLLGINLAYKLKIHCIGEVRDLWPEVFFYGKKLRKESILGKILLLGENYLYKKLSRIIFLKEGDIEYIKEQKWSLKQGGNIDLKKIFYINNGVNLEEFDSNSILFKLEDKDLEEEKFKIVYIGAIRKVNNLKRIVDVAEKVQENSDIIFLIYGDGNERNSLEKYCNQKKIKNIKFKGYVSKKYIPYILKKSNINILNYSGSDYNWTRGNSSNKLFEYMASGKPIISTIKTGYSIIKKYNCGLELENETNEEFYDKIMYFKKLDDSYLKKIGENGRKGVQDFTYKNLTLKLLNIIEELEQENEKDI